MSDVYIFSTLSCDTKYTTWRKGGGDMKIRDKAILIKGGSNVINKNLVTPQGVMTTVTEDELAILEEIPQFSRHKQRGFIVVERKAVPIEDVVSDMTGRSEDAPLVPEDYDAEEAAAPKVNAVVPKKPPKRGGK